MKTACEREDTSFIVVDATLRRLPPAESAFRASVADRSRSSRSPSTYVLRSAVSRIRSEEEVEEDGESRSVICSL